MSESRPLNGLRVLLVEDESLVAILAEDLLIEAGCEVVLAMRLNEAIDLAETEKFDIAVLDVNLGGGTTTFPLAGVLNGLGIPFAFATGYGPDAVSAKFPEQQVIRKPYSSHALREVISKAVGERRAE
jgi:CheY-like chemotaxis protein